MTDVSETQARYSLAEAQVIEARDALDAAQRELEVIIGVPLNQLDELQVLRPGKFQVAPLIPSKFEEWQKIALENNPVLAASRHGVDAAKYEVERNRAGFMPSVQLYASHSENDSSSDNTVNQKYRTDSIGVQVSCRFTPAAAWRPQRGRRRHATARRWPRWTRRLARR